MICRHHELPFGAELVSGGVRFRLWAPRAHSAVLELADAVLPMNREAGGWFALITDRAGAGRLRRCDPASRSYTGTRRDRGRIDADRRVPRKPRLGL